MKKKLFISAILIGLGMMNVQAQTMTHDKEKATQKIKLTGGAILEANLTNFIHSGIDKGSSDMKMGASIGGFLNLGLSSPFSIQGEMLFHYKTSYFNWNSHAGKYQYWGVEIPIYAMYSWNVRSNNQLYVGIGPYTNFGLGARFKEGGQKIDVYEKEENTGLPIMKDSDTGFGIKLGYELTSGLQFNVAYKVSVTNIIDANSSSVKMKPQTFAFGIAYRWGK